MQDCHLWLGRPRQERDPACSQTPQSTNSTLCRKIRGILFPLLEDGALFTGTRPDPPKKLYDPIIEAFEDAIEDSKK